MIGFAVGWALATQMKSALASSIAIAADVN
jgi:hypothetical protein